MRAAIAAWAMRVGTTPAGTPPDETLESAALRLADATEGAAGGRSDANVIARYEFREGSGEIVHDTSGVAPALDLALSGATWLPGGGVEFASPGQALGSAAASRKLYDRIARPVTGSNQFTIEAWLTPADTRQEGPARTVSYSIDPRQRNFMLGQVGESYRFRTRSRAAGINENGDPSLVAEGDLEAALQHVVMTFDQSAGRRIYVNGAFTEDRDAQGPGALDNWNPNYRLALANEVTNDRPWRGKLHFVAIHDRALTAEQVMLHYVAGAGRSFRLRFDVSAFVGAASTVEFEVSELDAYSYLFTKPTFVGPNPNGLRIQGIRIAVNGQAPVAGQAFRNVDTLVTASGQELSPLASVIAKDLGPEQDVFTLLFDVIGDRQAVVAEENVPLAVGGYLDEARPGIGIRDFDQIERTMAALTGVDRGTPAVRETAVELIQQLPGDSDVRTFVSSHQVAVFKLALEYCDVMVETPALRDAFFGTAPRFGFNAAVPTAFADPASKQRIADRLVDGMFGANLASQPGRDAVRPLLVGLMDTLTAGCNATTCPAERTRSVVKAVCGATLSSAPVLLY
jgi:hypothetical protein